MKSKSKDIVGLPTMTTRNQRIKAQKNCLIHPYSMYLQLFRIWSLTVSIPSTDISFPIMVSTFRKILMIWNSNSSHLSLLRRSKTILSNLRRAKSRDSPSYGSLNSMWRALMLKLISTGHSLGPEKWTMNGVKSSMSHLFDHPILVKKVISLTIHPPVLTRISKITLILHCPIYQYRSD